MKKILNTSLVIITLIVLVGCSHTVNSSKQNVLFKQLKDQKIISKGLKEIDSTSFCSRTFGACGCDYTYIYKDSNGELVSIKYLKGGKNYDYMIVICHELVKNKNYTGPKKLDKTDYDYDDCYYSTSDKYVKSSDSTCETYLANENNKKYEFTKN